MAPPTRPPDEEVVLQELRAIFPVLFRVYAIPLEDADEILSEVDTIFAHKQHEVSRPALWLFRLFVRQCDEWLQTHGGRRRSTAQPPREG